MIALLKALLCEGKDVCFRFKSFETNDNKQQLTPDDHLCTRSCSVFLNSFTPQDSYDVGNLCSIKEETIHKVVELKLPYELLT